MSDETLPSDFLQRRFQRMADDCLVTAQNEMSMIQSKASGSGNIGSSRTYLQINEAFRSAYRQTLLGMAGIAFHVTGGHSEEAAMQLDRAASELIEKLHGSLAERYRGGRAFGDDQNGYLRNLRQALESERSAVLDDFRHGLLGDTPLKKDPVVSVVTNIANSPGAVQQTAVGDRNQQSVQQQSTAIVCAIDDMLSSQEFRDLGEDQQTAVRDVAEVVRSEASKPQPDESKLKRWGRRLYEIAEQVGLQTAAAILAKLFVG